MTVLASSATSRADNSYEAGHQVATQVLTSLQGTMPEIFITFITEQYNQSEVLHGICSVTGSVPLIGCCAGGVIGGEGILKKGVGLLALHGAGLQTQVALQTGLRQLPGPTATRAIEQIEAYLPGPADKQSATVLVFSDGLTGGATIDEALQSAYAMLGPLCPIVGAAAGDDLHFQKASVFVNDQVVDDGFAVALVRSSTPLGIGVCHGWHPIGPRLVVTRSERNIAYQFNNQPAFDVYRQVLPELELTLESFHEKVHFYPLGLPQVNGAFLVRVPVQAHPDGSIEFLADLPENTVANILEGSRETLLQAAQDAACRAVEALGGRPPAAALIVDCASRPPLLGDAVTAEIEQIRAVLGHTTPILGMYSLGEIAPNAGVVAFHNKTVVVCVIAQS